MFLFRSTLTFSINRLNCWAIRAVPEIGFRKMTASAFSIYRAVISPTPSRTQIPGLSTISIPRSSSPKGNVTSILVTISCQRLRRLGVMKLRMIQKAVHFTMQIQMTWGNLRFVRFILMKMKDFRLCILMGGLSMKNIQMHWLWYHLAEMMGHGIKNIHDVSLEDILLSGHSARKLSYTAAGDNEASAKQTIYFYRIDYEMYVICFTSSADLWDQYELVFEEIMDSYTITAPVDNSSQDEESPVSAVSGCEEGICYMSETISMMQGNTGSYDITMTDWGTYTPEYSDRVYVYVTFQVVNTGDEEIHISDYSFNAYVNNYNVDIGCMLADNNLSATLSPGRQTSGNVYIEMNPEDVNHLELELGNAIFRIQDNGYAEEVPFGYEGEEDYTDYIWWGGTYGDGWLDMTLTFSLYSDGTQDPECGYMTTNFRGMEHTGKLYYLGGNEFRWEDEGYESNGGATYYVRAVYNNEEYQLELYDSDGVYDVTFTLYEQYVP